MMWLVSWIAAFISFPSADEFQPRMDQKPLQVDWRVKWSHLGGWWWMPTEMLAIFLYWSPPSVSVWAPSLALICISTNASPAPGPSANKLNRTALSSTQGEGVEVREGVEGIMPIPYLIPQHWVLHYQNYVCALSLMLMWAWLKLDQGPLTSHCQVHKEFPPLQKSIMIIVLGQRLQVILACWAGNGQHWGRCTGFKNNTIYCCIVFRTGMLWHFLQINWSVSSWLAP